MDGLFNSVSSFKIPDIDPGQDISALTVTFSLKIKGQGTPGRGMSLSFGNIPDGDGDGELGFALPRGLEIAWQTVMDNGVTQGAVVVYANREIVTSVPVTFANDDTFRPVSVIWKSTGLTVLWDSNSVVTDLAVPGFVPAVGDRLAFTARTGETTAQELAIDSLKASTTPSTSIDTGGPVITEFVAENSSSYEDEDVANSDWLEIYNGSASPAAMAGWFLTDDPMVLNKWTLPAFSMASNSYRVIFASGKDRTVSSGTLHTNFSLKKSGGYLALVRPDMSIATEFRYPGQDKDVAYGEIGSARRVGYLETPTPGKKNISLVADGLPAEKVVFSREGGLLTTSDPVVLGIAAPTQPGSVVRFTKTQALPSDLSPVWTETLSITNTTTVRARVYAPGRLPGPPASRTFLKLDTTLTNYAGTGQVFSSNLPVIVFDSAGVNVDATTSPSAARPYRPTYAVVVPPDASGRARLDGPVDYQGRSATHVRGESSSGFDQKSYAWEMWGENDNDAGHSLLGMPSESDWVLHGPYSDKTMMRNYLVYSTFLESRADWFAPRTRFVEVFFNQQANNTVGFSDYKGVYLLVEKIKRDRNRVDISKLSPLTTAQPTVSGGFIFKKDKASLGSTGWSSSQGVPLQSNEPETYTTPQLNAIRTYVNSFESALNGANSTNPTTGYAAWIDVDTFIDWQLAVELTKQIDGYVFSTYFHKERGGKMRAGPLWDFNISLGNANYGEGEASTGWDYDASRTAALTGQLWFPKLLSDPNYRMATFDRYWELRRSLWSTPSILARIDAVSGLLRDGKEADVTNATPAASISPIARHFRKYPILGSAPWPNPSSATTRRTFQSEVEYMKTWITSRLAWIDNQYGVLSTAARPPVMIRTDAGNGAARIAVTPFAGTESGVNFPQGTVYYTTNGTDPRPANSKIPTSATFNPLAEYAQAAWLVPTAANGGTSLPLESWINRSDPPNAASWTAGQLGIGFETAATSSANPFKYYMSGAHVGNTTWDGGAGNLESSMLNVSSSAFVRVPFALTADQRTRLVRLQLKVRADDGFIAYVNGVEAARLNVKQDTAATWETVADDIPSNYTDTKAGAGVTIDISHVIPSLQEGSNVLAILALNRSATDNDFLCSPSLLGNLAVKPTGTAPVITATAYTAPIDISTTVMVKTRLFVPETGLWSPITTSIQVVGAQPASRENLVISEINYDPLPQTPAEPGTGPINTSDFEFLEFLNTSAEPVDLANVRISGAVDEFNFSQGDPAATVVPPGGRVILCNSLAAFQVRYGNDPNVRIAGEFSGNLSNSGEIITLTDKDGAVIWSFAYNNKSPWPLLNAGLGSSIVLNNPARHPAPDPSLGSNWRASAAPNGAPGLADSFPIPANPLLDDDGDGISNLLEYLFGSNPGDPASKSGPVVVYEPGAGGAPGTIRLDVPRSSSADGFTWTIETSTDLTQWTVGGQTRTGSERSTNGQITEHWSVLPPPGFTGQKLFYRIKAQIP